MPGEATAAAIVADGHALAVRGEGRYATGAAISASMMGALFGMGVLVAFIPLAPRVLAHVGSPELAALAIVGICLLVPLSHSDPVKGLFSGALGLALATVGLDPFRAEPRFTFAQLSLWDGLGLLPVALGIFAVAEALAMIRSRHLQEGASTDAGRGVIDGVRESVRQAGLVFRCSTIGAVIGSLPGVGASVTQWIAYAHAQTSTRRERPAGTSAPGSGAIEGVIGPASATTATHGGAMVPTLALGIPGGLASSFLLSALILKGIAPGPTMLLPASAGGHLTLVFALVWCTVIASAIGALIGLGSLGWVVRLARVRPALLFPVILTFVLIGTVAERHATADLGVLLVLGGLGYAMSILKWPRAPLMLAFVLGPMVERRVLLSNTLYGWSWVLRPTVMVLAAVGHRLAPGRRAARAGVGEIRSRSTRGVGIARRCRDERLFRRRRGGGPGTQSVVDRPPERVSANRFRCDVRRCHFCSSLCRGASSRPVNLRDGRGRETTHISSESPGSCFSSPTPGSSAWSSAPRHRRSCICGGTRRNRGERRSR